MLCSSGFTWINLTLDNSNIGFNYLTLYFLSIFNWIAEFESKSNSYLYIFIVLFLFLYLVFIINSLVMFFIYYECLIILLLYDLYNLLLSYYRIRTAFYYFLFSISGNINFIIALFYIVSSINLYLFIIILPFLIKVPTFPFYYWLPEVHCEGNISISLYLAGLLLKLSIFSINRYIWCSFILSVLYLLVLTMYFILIGVIIIHSSYFRYYDLKKSIALSTILHLNLLLYSLLCLNSSGLYCIIMITLCHSLSTIGLFSFIWLLIDKTNIRLLDTFLSVSSTLRLIILFFILANNSFPCSINYIGEIFVLLAIISIDVLFTLVFLLVTFLSTLFWFIVLNRKLPYYSSYYFYFILYYYLFYYLLSYIYLLGIYLLV